MEETSGLDRIISGFPSQMQLPMWQLVDWMRKERKDFSELKLAVQDLTVTQAHTEQKVQELAEAQARTEQSLHELSADIKRLETAQERTDQRLAEFQTRTDQRFQELAEAQARTEDKVNKLAEAQARTDQRLAEFQERTDQRFQELAEAQQRTDQSVRELAETQAQSEKRLSDQIAALGGRWGIYNEGMFRSTLQGILSSVHGTRVEEGFYGGRQVDIIIRDGEHILLEITSRMHSKDIEKLYRSADDCRSRTGIEPKLMVATSYVSPKVMQKIMGLERRIDIFSYEGEE
jgi:hypothetical protein